MSGCTPRHAFTVPAKPAEDCKIQVDQAVIDALRNQIPISREDAMRWVDCTFENAALKAYREIGEPPLGTVSSAWKIFASMASLINISDAVAEE